MKKFTAMATLISNTDEEPIIITNDGFFPDVNVEKVSLAVRIDASIRAESVEHSLKQAIMRANHDLRHMKNDQMDANIFSLADVVADMIDGESVLILAYFEAVASWAKSLILETYRDTDTTVVADTTADLKGNSVEAFKRRYYEAIRKITGKPRATVELI